MKHEFTFPAWSQEHIIREATISWNLRHSREEYCDPETSESGFVVNVALACLRHSLSLYDTIREPETRDALREEIRVAAGEAYPWLRPETDPRQTEPAVAPPRDDRVMNELSRTLADLYSWKAQLESVLRDLKRERPPDGKVKVAALQAELAELDARIAQEHECCQIIQDQANLPKGEFWDRGPKALVMFRQRDPEYLFGGKSLPASYTQLLGYSCCHCGQLVRRSKAPVDAGNGIKKLYAISCHCFSILMPRDYSYPSAKVWDELYETPGRLTFVLDDLKLKVCRVCSLLFGIC